MSAPVTANDLNDYYAQILFGPFAVRNGVTAAAAGRRMVGTESAGLAIDFTSEEARYTDGSIGSAFVLTNPSGAETMGGAEANALAFDFTDATYLPLSGLYGSALSRSL